MTETRSRTSAGLLLFRKRGVDIEVLLVHPGGPFFRNKDAGAWTIPKGEAAPGEDLLTRAKIEFGEELGIESPANVDYVSLGSIRQKGGKTVHAFAVEGDLPDQFVCRSNTFDLEWPPRSGKHQSFPEIDRAEFFSVERAREKINPAQVTLLDRLVAHLNGELTE